MELGRTTTSCCSPSPTRAGSPPTAERAAPSIVTGRRQLRASTPGALPTPTRSVSAGPPTPGFNTGHAASHQRSHRRPERPALPVGALGPGERAGALVRPACRERHLPREPLLRGDLSRCAAFVGGRVFNVSDRRHAGSAELRHLRRGRLREAAREVLHRRPCSDGVPRHRSSSHVVENPKISAIEVIPSTTSPPPPPSSALFRVNAGGAAFTDASGNAWAAIRTSAPARRCHVRRPPWTGANRAALLGPSAGIPPAAPELSVHASWSRQAPTR